MAIEDVNNRDDILPNTTLVGSVYDTQSDPALAIRGVTQHLNDHAVGIVGAASSSLSISSQLVARAFTLPQVSYASTSPELSNKILYGYFTRVVPPDNFQGRALASLCLSYGWTRVATLFTNDAYGQSGINAFTDAAAELGIEVATAQGFPVGATDVTSYLENVRDSGARVFVLFVNAADAIVVLRRAPSLGLFQPHYMWLGSDGWATDTVVTGDLRVNCSGMLGTRPSAGAGPLHDAFVADWNRRNPFPGLNPDSKIYQAYDSVLTYAYALDSMIRANQSIVDNGPGLLAAILATQFMGVTGAVSFDANGDRIGTYDVVNLQGAAGFKPVATWGQLGGLVPLLGVDIVWPGGGGKPSGAPTLACKRGFYLFDGLGSKCIACSPGNYSTVADSPTCFPCGAGNYTSQPGSTECVPCSPGTYSGTGASACSMCDTSSYGATHGLAQCTPCPHNTIVPYKGAISEEECGCQSGFYATINDTECLPCPAGGSCEGANKPPKAAYGSWLAPSAATTFVFQKCYPDEACPGGAVAACGAGYGDELCSSCILGYYRKRAECEKCLFVSPIRFAFLCALFVVLMFFGYRISNFQVSSVHERLGIGTTLGATTNFLQTSFMLSKMKNTGSTSISIMTAMGVINFDYSLLGISCDVYISYEVGYALRVLFPVFIGAAMVLLHLGNKFHCYVWEKLCINRPKLASLQRHKPKKKCSCRNLLYHVLVPQRMRKRRTINFMLMVIEIGYIFVTSAAFEVLSCYDQWDGTKSLHVLPKITCFTREWATFAWLGFLALALYGIGVPIIFAWIYKQAREHIDDDNFVETYGWLFSRFKRHLNWWGALTLARKLVLTFSVVTFNSNYPIQVLGAMIPLVVCLVLEVRFRPYALSIHNNLTGFLLMVNVISLIIVVALNAPAATSDKTMTAVLDSINIVFMALGLVACVVITAKQIISQRKAAAAGPVARREQRRREYLELFRTLRISTAVIEEWLHKASQDDVATLKALADDVARTQNRLNKSGVPLAALMASSNRPVNQRVMIDLPGFKLPTPLSSSDDGSAPSIATLPGDSSDERNQPARATPAPAPVAKTATPVTSLERRRSTAERRPSTADGGPQDRNPSSLPKHPHAHDSSGGPALTPGPSAVFSSGTLHITDSDPTAQNGGRQALNLQVIDLSDLGTMNESGPIASPNLSIASEDLGAVNANRTKPGGLKALLAAQDVAPADKVMEDVTAMRMKTPAGGLKALLAANSDAPKESATTAAKDASKKSGESKAADDVVAVHQKTKPGGLKALLAASADADAPVNLEDLAIGRPKPGAGELKGTLGAKSEVSTDVAATTNGRPVTPRTPADINASLAIPERSPRASGSEAVVGKLKTATSDPGPFGSLANRRPEGSYTFRLPPELVAERSAKTSPLAHGSSTGSLSMSVTQALPPADSRKTRI